MDKILEQLKKPLWLGILCFAGGLIVGLVILGWWLWPVQWTDAAPQHLRADLQEDYLRMAVDSYFVHLNSDQAKARFDELGADAGKWLDQIQSAPSGQSAEAIAAFRTAVLAGPQPSGAGTPVASTQVAEGDAETKPAASKGIFGGLLPVLCGALLLVVAGLFAYFYMQNRAGGPGRPTTQVQEALAGSETAAPTGFQAVSEEPPIFQSMASYKLGDEYLDDSYNINSPAGEYLGECGLTISETIGVGDPKKVAAFEVWLFDINDPRTTVTKVLMTNYAFGDETTNTKLKAKGEPLMVMPGTETVLETQSLRMVVRVIDMGYGDGPLPPQSFFDRLILELGVWKK